MNEATERANFMSYFESCSVFNGKGFDMYIPRVFTYAIKYGLDDQDMFKIVSIALERRLSFMRMKKLLRCLIPRIYVPDEVIELVLQYLFKKIVEKEVPALLNFILHWLIGILQYKLVLSKECIHKYYNKFYELFAFKPTAVSACRIIYLLTSPQDVRKEYVDIVMKLHSFYTLYDRNHFGVLLRLFKCYKPSLVPNPVRFYSVNKHFGTISDGINHSLSSAYVRIRNNYKVVRALNGLLWDKKLYQHIVLKRAQVQLIPLFPESKITNEDIRKLIVSGIVISTLYKYDVETPSNLPTSILSLLKNSNGRYLLAHGDEIVQIRFCIELVVVLKDAFFIRKDVIPHQIKEKLLTKISVFQNELNQAIPTVTEFIADFLKTWDGYEHLTSILNIIEWLHIKSIPFIYESILSKIRNIFMNASLPTKCLILLCLGNFIVNTMNFQAREINGKKTLFLKETVHLDFTLLFKNLLKYFQNICVIGITKEEAHTSIMQTICLMHEKIISAGKSIRIKNVPIKYVIDYWPAFESDFNMLIRIADIQNNIVATNYIDEQRNL